ncbi:hypothetical protein V5799_018252 [Amblyomma americanum]|uniref:Uncharacterized protein n=1 Tax=Amblyomma americanum TaxID=6943 RepID=A0AAQ4EBX1_AMBAM
MSKRKRLVALAKPSVLLLAANDSTDSSSDEDDTQVYTAMFTELFTVPAKIPKVTSYVDTTVRQYSESEFRRNFRLPRKACYELVSKFEGSNFYPSSRNHGGSPAKTAEEHLLSFLW